AHEVNGAHFGDERIALGHVADQRADLFGFVGNVEAEDVRSAGRRLMKSEQRVNEHGFAGAVGAEQTDGFATQVTTKVLQDLPATKRNAEAVQVDHWRLCKSRWSLDQFLWNRSWECHTLFIALRPDNSKRIRVRRLCPSAEKRQCMLTHLTVLKFCQSQEIRSGKQAC